MLAGDTTKSAKYVFNVEYQRNYDGTKNKLKYMQELVLNDFQRSTIKIVFYICIFSDQDIKIILEHVEQWINLFHFSMTNINNFLKLF